jgi:hypothetical protein
MTIDKQIENIQGFARDMRAIIAHAREIQTQYLSERGMTWEQARALRETEQDALQTDYSAWHAKQIS